MGETQIYSRQERSDQNTKSNQMKLKYVRCKVKKTLNQWMKSQESYGLDQEVYETWNWSKVEIQVTYESYY